VTREPGPSAAAAALERSKLAAGATALGLTLSDDAVLRLTRLLDELGRWNAAYNLTSIRQREGMLTHHLLDSLSIHGDLAGATVADVGTGAGFPGLPLAIADSGRHFTLIDSNNKKVRFVAHAARALGLDNVTAVHARAEHFAAPGPFDTVVARALAPLPQLLAEVRSLCGPGTRVLAMKGRRPDDEIAAIPPQWALVETRALSIPGLDAERHVVVLALAPSASPL
jgi:16S rRNA (guanine527-N7)-methyltransferase